MTPEQYRLYRAAIRIARAFGAGGAIWAGQRASAVTPAADAAIDTLPLTTIRFVENNMVRPAQALPVTPIYTAPWWGVAAAGADVRVGDMYSNGTLAFLITGQPDTSQGFVLAPAAPAAVPQNHVGGGFQVGLRIGVW